MKFETSRCLTRASLIIALLLALIIISFSRRPRPPATSPQPVSFSGFTNGYVGVFAPMFAMLRTNNGALIRKWRAAGTNSAVFTITNQQSCDIDISPIGHNIHNPGPPPSYELTPVLNAPNFSGIRLKPGQVTNLLVAVVPDQALWRMQFHYTRADQHIGFFELLNSLILQEPIRARTYTVTSDLISQ